MRPFLWIPMLLRVFLLTAFVHQLGACVCGSLDHNHWYQTVVRSCSPSHTHHHGSHQPQESSTAPELQHDQAHGQLVYLASCSVPELESLAQAAAPAQLVAHRIEGEHLAIAHSTWKGDFQGSLPVRAQLQIFLL